MQRLTRFARYWELVANSGRFTRGLRLMVGDAPFARFMRFADWLYATTGKTHEIALERLFGFVYEFATRELGVDETVVSRVLADDYEASGARGRLAFITPPKTRAQRARETLQPLRQVRHLQR